MRHNISISAAILVSSVLPAALDAAQISLSPANVIGAKDSYGSSFNSGGFAANNVLSTQSGSITEPVNQQVGYWLNSDNGPADTWITVDLGTVYRVEQMEFFNTHNAQFNDRGTGNFNVTGNQRVNLLGGSQGHEAVGVVNTLVNGTLLPEVIANDPIDGQSFVVPRNFTRYVRFNPTSVAAGGIPCCGINNYGLNEIRLSGYSTFISGLGPSNVIGASQDYDGGDVFTGQFNATQILDNQGSNTIAEPAQSGFWLNPDAPGGLANAYLVIDLGQAYELGAIEMFNTHNAQFNDRGIGNFDVIGGNSVSFVDAARGFDLSGTTYALTSGTMTGISLANDPIYGEVFGVAQSQAVRYVRIQPHSGAAGGALITPVSYGLNEVRFYATPEPASLSLAAVGLAGLGFARRRVRV